VTVLALPGYHYRLLKATKMPSNGKPEGLGVALVPPLDVGMLKQQLGGVGSWQKPP
jgi:hypothetical protein